MPKIGVSMLKKYYFFHDTETGGLDSGLHKLLEIGSAIYDEEGNELEHFQKFLNPIEGNKKVTLYALKVNNCFSRKGDLEAYDYNITVARNYAEWCVSVVKKYSPVLVGQNINFDVGFTNEFMSEQGFLGWSDLFSYHRVDTCVLGYQLIDSGIIQAKSPSLKNLSDFFKIENPCAHGALEDARTTAKVYFAMKNIFKNFKVNINEESLDNNANL